MKIKSYIIQAMCYFCVYYFFHTCAYGALNSFFTLWLLAFQLNAEICLAIYRQEHKTSVNHLPLLHSAMYTVFLKINVHDLQCIFQSLDQNALPPDQTGKIYYQIMIHIIKTKYIFLNQCNAMKAQGISPHQVFWDWLLPGQFAPLCNS